MNESERAQLRKRLSLQLNTIRSEMLNEDGRERLNGLSIEIRGWSNETLFGAYTLAVNNLQAIDADSPARHWFRAVPLLLYLEYLRRDEEQSHAQQMATTVEWGAL